MACRDAAGEGPHAERYSGMYRTTPGGGPGRAAVGESVDLLLIDKPELAWLTHRKTAGARFGTQLRQEKERQEKEMVRRTAFALTAALVSLLVLSVFAQAWLLPAAVARGVAAFPEVEPLAVPAIMWGMCAIACWQAMAAIGLRLVISARDHRLNTSSGPLLRAMLGCLLAFIALVVAAFIALNAWGYTTPGVMLGLIAAGFAALIATGALLLFLGTRPATPYFSHS